MKPLAVHVRWNARDLEEPDVLEAQAPQGRPPQIASPLAKVEYAVRVGDPTYGEIPFIAVVPSDATTVFWY